MHRSCSLPAVCTLTVLLAVSLLGVQPLVTVWVPTLGAQPAAEGSGFAAGGTSPPRVVRAAGSTRKLCQLTGEVDRQQSQTTSTRTQTAFGLVGTDLGASFEHRGHIYFLFGDSHPSREGNPFRPVDGDSIGYRGLAVHDPDQSMPADCSGLHLITAPDGHYLAPRVPQVSLGSFEVPTGGFSSGASMYVFFATDSTPEQVMQRTVLARSDDDGRTFSYLYDVSRGKFINVAPVVVRNAAIPGLPEASGRGVLLWASGKYRESDPYLAWVPLAAVETPSAWRYFAGIDPNTRRPRWSEHEADAVPLFSHPCIGELSVGWNAVLGVWMMLYNCIENPRGIVFRVAAEPWGPWSAAGVLFDPWADNGYCHFIHTSWEFATCDSVHDPGRENEWGGEYGPYLINQYTTGTPGRSTIYFVMSTWNPYRTVLMQSVLERAPGEPPAQQEGTRADR